jgi:hypothetical protein
LSPEPGCKMKFENDIKMMKNVINILVWFCSLYFLLFQHIVFRALCFPHWNNVK